jgi:hypothetical protein|tara:strand:+ start:11004 stop:11141 length:138 start_codon:yes stop_codon:yes gene_type:complete
LYDINHYANKFLKKCQPLKNLELKEEIKDLKTKIQLEGKRLQENS